MGLIKCSLWLPSRQSLITEIDKDWHICTNYRLEEFANNEAKDDIKFVIEDKFGWLMMQMMQDWRDYFGSTEVTSGYRTQAFNDSLPNATHDSQHCHMKAVDIARGSKISIDDYIKFWRALCVAKNTVGAIGLYDDFVHAEIESDKRYGQTRFEVRDFR